MNRRLVLDSGCGLW